MYSNLHKNTVDKLVTFIKQLTWKLQFYFTIR